jgi:hypothetical protein
MNEQLKNLIAEHGMAAMLAGIRFQINDEVNELLEFETPEDTATAGKLEEIATELLTVALKYDALAATVA